MTSSSAAPVSVGELVDGFLDDVQGLLDLLISDHQRRCQADDVFVSRLSLEGRLASQPEIQERPH